MKKQIITLMLVFLLVLPMLSAEASFIFKQNQEVDLKIPVYDEDNNRADSSIDCFITIRSPSSELVVDNKNMSFNTGGIFNYTVPDSNVSTLGEYPCSISCEGGTVYGFSTFSFEVTTTGSVFEEGQGVAAFAILVGALGLSFLFLILGFKLGENPNFSILAFFFVVLSLFLGIYSLSLGWSYSQSILQYEGISNVAEVIYITILWLVIGIAVISSALMLIAFIKELGTISKSKQFGDDFDPLTNTYS